MVYFYKLLISMNVGGCQSLMIGFFVQKRGPLSLRLMSVNLSMFCVLVLVRVQVQVSFPKERFASERVQYEVPGTGYQYQVSSIIVVVMDLGLSPFASPAEKYD